MTQPDIQQSLIRQYRAALSMLRQAVSQCPEPLWLAPGYRNRTWQLAYHAAFYTHLYLHASSDAFVPWVLQRPDYQFLGPTPWPPHQVPVADEPYTRQQILDYCDLCLALLEPGVASPALDAPSGFSWLPFNRLELHLYNLRHLQSHVGQLAERLRNAADIGVAWTAKA